jgi:hypothetical protein
MLSRPMDSCTIVVIISFIYNAMIVKILFLLCFANSCGVYQQRPELYQHWVHSHEEDDRERDYRVYRPSTYEFPPARGRESFQLKQDGVAIAHPIAPNDGNLTIMRKWKMEGDRLIIEGEEHVSTFQIISVSSEKLVVHPFYPNK